MAKLKKWIEKQWELVRWILGVKFGITLWLFEYYQVIHVNKE